MDGRNAGSAVIGFVNGMYIIQFHSSHTHTHRHARRKVKIVSFSSKTIQKKKNHTHTQRQLQVFLFCLVVRKEKLGMTQRKTEHVTT